MLIAEDPSSSNEDPWDMPSQRGQKFIYLSKYKYYAYRKFLLYILYIYIYIYIYILYTKSVRCQVFKFLIKWYQRGKI